MSNDLMTTREMSDQFGVTLRLLRYYEEKGLLSPAREGNRRLFGKRDKARLKLILKGQTYGFKLEEMRRLLDLYDEGKEQQQLIEVHKAGSVHLSVLKQSRKHLDETIAELELRLFNCLAQIDGDPAREGAIA